MPWTETTRPHDARRGRRSTSDLTDAEWVLVAGFRPPPKQPGRPRTTELRDVLDAILSMAASGCQWAMLPKDFPPPSTVQRYFYDWRDSPFHNGSSRSRLAWSDGQTASLTCFSRLPSAHPTARKPP